MMMMMMTMNYLNEADNYLFETPTVNKQPLFTVKNPPLQLVKIDHAISVYLSLTGKTVINVNLCFLV